MVVAFDGWKFIAKLCDYTYDTWQGFGDKCY